jgi:hypothetical protein
MAAAVFHLPVGLDDPAKTGGVGTVRPLQRMPPPRRKETLGEVGADPQPANVFKRLDRTLEFALGQSITPPDSTDQARPEEWPRISTLAWNVLVMELKAKGNAVCMWDCSIFVTYRFKGVIPNRSKYAQFSGPTDWLVGAGLALRVQLVERAEQPLKSFVKESLFKLYMFDVGLLGCALDLPVSSVLNQDYGSYRGFFAENLVAQEFSAENPANLGWLIFRDRPSGS